MPVKIARPLAITNRTNVALRDKETLCERVLKLVAEGMPLRDACIADSSFPSYGTFFTWMRDDAKLKSDYQFAQELARDALVEKAAKKLADIEIRDESYVRHGKKYEIRSTDKLGKANLEANFTRWQVGRLDSRFAPKIEIDGGAISNGDPRVYMVVGALPDFPLGELLTDEERRAELDRARLSHERRDGQRVDSPLELGGAVDEEQSSFHINNLHN